MTTMRTQAEIARRAEEVAADGDIFGAELIHLVEVLPWSDAKAFMKASAKADWKPESADRDAVIARMTDYMEFAWGKANDCRGISAQRSLCHMRGWLWLAGEDALVQMLDDDYSHYGKPQLRSICQALGIDWKVWDDGEWRNSEGGICFRPDEVSEIKVEARAHD